LNKAQFDNHGLIPTSILIGAALLLSHSGPTNVAGTFEGLARTARSLFLMPPRHWLKH